MLTSNYSPGARTRPRQRHRPDDRAQRHADDLLLERRDHLSRRRSLTVPNGGGSFTSSLMSQLKMVAKIIEAGYRASTRVIGSGDEAANLLRAGRRLRSAHRPDEQRRLDHDQQRQGDHRRAGQSFRRTEPEHERLPERDDQIGATYGDAAFDQRVTSFTVSDFGRTFPSNSLGSDHGWGSHHMVNRRGGARPADLRHVADPDRRRPG